jgi:hypothetical protein
MVNFLNLTNLFTAVRKVDVPYGNFMLLKHCHSQSHVQEDIRRRSRCYSAVRKMI